MPVCKSTKPIAYWILSCSISTSVYAQQAAQPSPLDNLKDIRLPAEVNQYPNAPGWWILLALVIVICSFFIYRRYKFKQATKLIKPAKAEIERLKMVDKTNLEAHHVAMLSALLKRIGIIYYGKSSIASLNGSQWLNFLNQQSKKLAIDKTSTLNSEFFTVENSNLFLQAAYQKTPEIDFDEWQNLLSTSELWIEAVILNFAKKQNQFKSESEELASNGVNSIRAGEGS
jgi:hypothetical protein